MTKIFGYDYDEDNKKFTKNDREAEIIQSKVDLYTNYNLKESEINDILSGNLSLDQVINFRIYDIQNTLKYEYSQQIDFGNPLKIILNKDNIKKNLIDPLLEKQKFLEENFENNDIKEIIECIDIVLKLLKNRNNILDKYNNFEGTIETIKSIKGSEKEYIMENINPIISKEVWERANQALKVNNNWLELEEIDK